MRDCSVRSISVLLLLGLPDCSLLAVMPQGNPSGQGTRNCSHSAENVYVLSVDFGWSDLGTWASLHSELRQDEFGNVIQGEKVLTFDVNNSLIRIPKGKQVVSRGKPIFLMHYLTYIWLIKVNNFI